MADARLKLVRASLARIHDRANFILDLVDRRPDSEVKSGDTLEIPSLSALTVESDGSAANTAQNATPSVLTLSVNLEPAIFVNLKQRDRIQLLDGAWADEIGMQALINMRNYLDAAFLSYVARYPAWSTSGAYHVNLSSTLANSADAPARGDILTARALLLDQDGGFPQNLILVVNAWLEAQIMNLAEFIPNYQQAEQGLLGIPMLGRIFGIPVYQTNSVLKNKSVDASASNVATNVCTFTVPEGHGFVPNQKIRTSGFSTNITTDTLITSVTSNTIVAPLTASNGSNGTGTITAQDAESLLIDRGFNAAAFQKMPGTRIKPKAGTTTDELEVSTVWGRVGRNGRAVVIHHPAAALT